MKISELTTAGAIVGTEVLPIVQGGVTKKVSISNVIGANYKVYSALISQSGTDAPTAIVLQNTIGTITFTYNNIGQYNILSSGLFTADKIWTIPTYNDDTAFEMSILWSNANTLYFNVASGNDSLYKTSIEIRVYN
jgi:hypothetical protein